MPLGEQVAWLFILAIPIACISWTFTHEEIFRELREYCTGRSRKCPRLFQRKFFYLFTCEYCFSHYVAIFFAAITGYQLLLESWQGYVIGFFALVWVANIYMSIFGRLRLDIRSQRIEIAEQQESLDRHK